MKITFARPFERTHNKLREYVEGGKDMYANPEKLDELAIGEDLEELAWMAYDAERAYQGELKGYVDVNKPEKLDDGSGWVVRQTLNEEGQSMWDAINGGLCWHVEERRIDMDETERFYRDMMKSGSLEVRYAELIMANKSELTTKIRGEITYFKLAGDRKTSGNRETIVKVKDAA